MIDYRKTLGLAVVAISLMGAGCSGQTTTTIDSSASGTTPAAPTPVAEAPKTPIKFSEAEGDLFGLNGKYSGMTISGGTGTCLTKLPYTELSYSPSTPDSNFILRDKGVIIDENHSSSTPNGIMFQGKTTDGKDVDCIVRIPYAGETATLSCADEKEKEVCSATYTSLMVKPL